MGGVGRDSGKVSGPPPAFWGDFHTTLAMEDRPHKAGGRDLGLEEFREFLSKTVLQELGLVDWVYTWQSTASPTSLLSLDRLLWN